MCDRCRCKPSLQDSVKPQLPRLSSNWWKGDIAPLRDQAQKYGVELLNEEVISVEKTRGGFVASGGTAVSGRFVILATGLVDRTPNLEGFAEIEAAGKLRFWPVCDGYEAIDTRVGVLGDSCGRKEGSFPAHVHQACDPVPYWRRRFGRDLQGGTYDGGGGHRGRA